MAFVIMLALKIVANPYPFGSPVKCLLFSWLTLSNDLKNCRSKVNTPKFFRLGIEKSKEIETC